MGTKADLKFLCGGLFSLIRPTANASHLSVSSLSRFCLCLALHGVGQDTVLGSTRQLSRQLGLLPRMAPCASALLRSRATACLCGPPGVPQGTGPSYGFEGHRKAGDRPLFQRSFVVQERGQMQANSQKVGRSKVSTLAKVDVHARYLHVSWDGCLLANCRILRDQIT